MGYQCVRALQPRGRTSPHMWCPTDQLAAQHQRAWTQIEPPGCPEQWPWGKRGEGPGHVGHKLTFLQLHTLEVEGVPQDVAAARLVLLGEEQQVRIGKQCHLRQARANRTGSSAGPQARSHDLPKGPGEGVLVFLGRTRSRFNVASAKGRDLTCSQDHPFALQFATAPLLTVGEHTTKRPSFTVSGRWPLQASPQPDAAQAHSSVQEPLESPALGPELSLSCRMSCICLYSPLNIWLGEHWT